MKPRTLLPTWLSRLYYGSSSPSPLRRLSVNAFFVGLVVVLYSFWTDFAPTPLWYRAGSIATAIFTAAVVCFAYVANARGHRFYLEGVSEIKKTFSSLLLPIFLFGLSWFGIVFGVGALFTKVAGEPTMIETRASKAYSPSRRFCDYRLVVEEVDPHLKICMSAEQFSRLQSGTKVRLIGKRSTLGLHVAGWELG
jgi:hypothetical protein